MAVYMTPHAFAGKNIILHISPELYIHIYTACVKVYTAAHCVPQRCDVYYYSVYMNIWILKYVVLYIYIYLQLAAHMCAYIKFKTLLLIKNSTSRLPIPLYVYNKLCTKYLKNYILFTAVNDRQTRFVCVHRRTYPYIHDFIPICIQNNMSVVAWQGSAIQRSATHIYINYTGWLLCY